MSVFAVLDPVVSVAHAALAGMSQVLPTAAAIVLLTVGVRLLLHPLARAAVRGEKTRTRLAPQLAALQRRHRKDPAALQKATTELYRSEGSSPLAGCLPLLLQLPFFSVMYRLFTNDGDLGGHGLFGVPLGEHVGAAHGGQLLVFLALYALLAGLGYVAFRRTRSAAPLDAAGNPAAKIAPYLSFGTVLFATLVPLAAGLYLATTTAWTLAERALLLRS
ncbi:YidC/Oxa1 family membrane protein insertase [Streptacidiphilus sp. MAP12-20]|uniref:membrane protein insertase YidC n=1 Tax=Streptacidiphilus sp. MAP12-20 TaxID=3156299 RepID=UPI003512034A